MRLLAALGGAWMMLLSTVTAPWASSHMLRWWACTLIDVSGTMCLLVGAVAVLSSWKLFNVLTLYGASSVACLGCASLISQGNSSSASLLFALTFFVLTVSVPLCVAAFCVFDLFRLKHNAIAET